MKISYSEYIKKADVVVLVAEIIFNELLKDSPVLKIKDVAKTTSGGTPKRSRIEYYNGDIPWLKSGELKDGKINDSEEFITELGLQNSSAKLHPKGTLLVAMYGANAGKTGVLEISASTNQAVCALYANEKVDNDYLFWFFRSHRYQFIEKSKGGAQPNISQTVIKQTKIPVPSKKVQNQVALILNKINEHNKIEFDEIPERFQDSVFKVLNYKNTGLSISTELSHQLSLVSQLRQAFLREAMQGKLVEQDPSDEPASELLARIKAEKKQLIKEKKIRKQKPLPPIEEEEIPFEIPESWEWCRLGDVYQTTSGGTPSRGNTNYWGGSITWYKSGELNDGYLSKDSKEKITELGLKKSSANLFPKGTLLIAMYGATAGKLSILDVDATTNQAVCGFFENSFIITKFLFFFFLANRSKMIEESWGMSQPNISQTYLRDFIFALPPHLEQKRIVAKLDELMSYCDQLEESIKNSQAQNEMLLEQVLREALEPEVD